MRIRVEPKEFFMHSIFLAFNKEHSDLEDKAVKAYLEEHELIPKAQGTDTLEGQEYDVMYFGGCYLGRHLNVIGDMQRKAVEQEMLTTEIGRILEETADPATREAADNTPEPDLKELISNLAEELHQESSFSADEEGYLRVALETDHIQRKFVELVGQSVLLGSPTLGNPLFGTSQGQPERGGTSESPG